MDDADFADIDQGARVDAAIETSRNIAEELKKIIHGNGFCMECDSPVEPKELKGEIIIGRFCSIDCRDAHEKYQKLFA